MALQGVGYQVVGAASGDALLVELDNMPLDIIVSDYRLARGETGYDVVSSVRQVLGDELPVIIITGDTDPKLIASMSERGIAVLHKPVQMEDLEVCLRNLSLARPVVSQST